MLIVLLAGTILSMFLVYGWTTIPGAPADFFPGIFCSVAFDAYAKAAGIFRDPLCEHILLFNNVNCMRGKTSWYLMYL